MAKFGLLFLGLFFLELWVVIKVGSVIGALMVIFLMIIAAGYGVSLVRSQGLKTMMTMQQQLAQGMTPADTLLEGAALLIAGALFIFPGFLTDIFALLLLQPQIRRWMAKKLLASGNWKVQTMGGATVEGEARQVHPETEQLHRHHNHSSSGTTVDGEYERKDDDQHK